MRKTAGCTLLYRHLFIVLQDHLLRFSTRNQRALVVPLCTSRCDNPRDLGGFSRTMLHKHSLLFKVSVTNKPCYPWQIMTHQFLRPTGPPVSDLPVWVNIFQISRIQMCSFAAKRDSTFAGRCQIVPQRVWGLDETIGLAAADGSFRSLIQIASLRTPGETMATAISQLTWRQRRNVCVCVSLWGSVYIFNQ